MEVALKRGGSECDIVSLGISGASSKGALIGKGQWMDWDGVAGSWRQWKGSARETWGRLTGNEPCILAGRRDRLLGRIQACCGIKPEEAEEELKEWGVL